MPSEGESEVEREDVEALLEVRRELGPSYDAALVDSFADRMERAIAQRVDAQLAQARAAQERQAASGGRQLALGIVSVACGIPITAISLALGGLPGLVVVWVAIVLVNLAHALSARARAWPTL
jgi:hypothetical protein